MLWNIDPWRELEKMRREIDTIFSSGGRVGGNYTFPLFNVYEGKDDIVVTAELPGMSKEEVNISFVEGTLTVSGNKKPLEKVKDMTVIRQERAEGTFEKSIRIPSKVEQEKINASFSEGILSITLPKAEEAKPKTITIEAK